MFLFRASGSMASPLRQFAWPVLPNPIVTLPRPSDMIAFARAASPALSSTAKLQENPDRTSSAEDWSPLDNALDQEDNMPVCTEASQPVDWDPN